MVFKSNPLFSKTFVHVLVHSTSRQKNNTLCKTIKLHHLRIPKKHRNELQNSYLELSAGGSSRPTKKFSFLFNSITRYLTPEKKFNTHSRKPNYTTVRGVRRKTDKDNKRYSYVLETQATNSKKKDLFKCSRKRLLWPASVMEKKRVG